MSNVNCYKKSKSTDIKMSKKKIMPAKYRNYVCKQKFVVEILIKSSIFIIKYTFVRNESFTLKFVLKQTFLH